MFHLSKYLWRWTNTLTPCQSSGGSYYGRLHVDYALSSWFFMDEQTPCITRRALCAVCGALIGQPTGLYNISLLNVFPSFTFHILDIYRAGNLWHLTLPKQEMYPAFFFFCFWELLAVGGESSHRASSCAFAHEHYTRTETVAPATTVTAHQLWGHGPVWPPHFVLTRRSCPWAGCYL